MVGLEGHLPMHQSPDPLPADPGVQVDHSTSVCVCEHSPRAGEPSRSHRTHWQTWPQHRIDIH